MSRVWKFCVKTSTGLVVYESYSHRSCFAYIRQAVKKGADPDFLRVSLAD